MSDDANPVVTLVAELRGLRATANKPAFREMGKRANFSYAALSRVVSGKGGLPTWPAVKAFVEACEGDPKAWLPRWERAKAYAAAADSAAPDPLIHDGWDRPAPTTQLQRQAADVGLEGIYPTRAQALMVFAEAIDRELKVDNGRIWICGSSLKGLIQIAIGNFDGSELFERIVKRGEKFDLRLLCTAPEHAERRARQESRIDGEIEKEIKLSLSHFRSKGVRRESVRYHQNMPNVFAIATSERMLLNPYPYGGEAFRDFTLIVHKTPNLDGIFERYLRKHFEAAWSSSDAIPDGDWFQGESGEE